MITWTKGLGPTYLGLVVPPQCSFHHFTTTGYGPSLVLA